MRFNRYRKDIFGNNFNNDIRSFTYNRKDTSLLESSRTHSTSVKCDQTFILLEQPREVL